LDFPDRVTLLAPCPESSGHLNVLESGCSWRKLPASFPVHWRTAHRRFAEWVEAGVMSALHRATLDVLGAAGRIDWSRVSVDSMHVRAVKRGT
ncbi:transposase, partial [Micromonospora sp. LOL_015]|uniref:transposase n=1 Tax=Micromonospora sp. LOL_015 TaxID=3345416 RepID=UPI003A845C96